MTQMAAISQQIWDMKYRLKAIDGTPVDKTIDHTWTRVASALAKAEKDPELWEPQFLQILQDFQFLPAGRILSGAGTERNVTLFNCFVMGDIPDDMAGIFESLKEAALTMQQGGGIGYDFSTLRPKGAPVKGVGADASGPLSFMDVWDAMCRTIMSAGSRRGAMMATMRCDHPDIEAFIEAKQEAGRLRMFNLSVLVTDAFMEAVRTDSAWELTFKDTTYRSLPARALWDKIMRATYAFAEPGVIFIDRINRRNNLGYIEDIHATNPCVTADTWVHTDQGPRQVAELIDQPFTAIVNGQPYAAQSGFFNTGTKDIIRLNTREGLCLRLTPDHLVQKATKITPWEIESQWIAAGSLQPGDEVILGNHRAIADWPGKLSEDHGYLLGLLIGNGGLTESTATLNAWSNQSATANGRTAFPPLNTIMYRAQCSAQKLWDVSGWVASSSQGQYRLALNGLKDLACELGLKTELKTISPAIERQSSGFYRGILSGLFDCDGSVQGTQTKGICIHLPHSSQIFLQAVQRMLLRLGIGSQISSRQTQNELVISGDNVGIFAKRLGFTDSEQQTRLTALLSLNRQLLKREKFTATITSLDPDGTAPVYDVQVPGPNAFDANGFTVHNCGEQPLPPYGVCLLGSINLARLVLDAFNENARLDLDRLKTVTRLAVRMLDNVIDISRFPLPAHEHEAKSKRRIGLGVTGLADALILCRSRYGSKDSIQLVETWMSTIRDQAYLVSTELAAEKGAFPLFDAERYLAGESIQELPQIVRDAIAQHGIRNALLTSIAPTGTISLFADNVSSGLEPVFSFQYTRTVLQADGSRRQEDVSDYAFHHYQQTKGEDTPLPDYFVDAQSLSPADHLIMQSVVQKYIDSSISKTINLPESIAFTAFKDIYAQAYDLGCKGCTTYRPNDVTGSVLTVKNPTEGKPEDHLEAGAIVHLTRPLDRPEALPGATYKVRWPESDHAMYITLNDIVQDGRRRPFEVFINSKNMEHYAWTVALTRMISAVFRRGGDVSFVVEELKAVFDPRGGQWVSGRYIPSLLAAIGDVIERHMVDIGFIPDPKAEREPADANDHRPSVNLGNSTLRFCPKCNQPALLRSEGCDTCTSCGYSKCG